MLKTFKVRGHSMEPSFKDGDRILTATFLKIKKGDAVVFKDKNKTYLKRVESAKGNTLFLKGDNPNHTSQHLIDRTSVKGKVVFKY